ncbi:MAG: divalent-cation tolerance protein CutA [Cyanobacteria bacterium]|nr:divalent-cation tolerance protein CutA [Synechococcus sp. BS307-5m-G38]MDA0258094.1 divalent-cation tolerance protein CutA [Cyanobacteriota bacterium]
MNDQAGLVLVLTTEADQERAEALAAAVLERRLAACVALHPVGSRYHWNGVLQQATEVQLLFKTSSARLSQLQQAVMALHSYDVPEWLAWPVDASPAYGSWARSELSSDGPPPDPAERRSNGHPAG